MKVPGERPRTGFSCAFQTGEGSDEPGALLRAGAESSHGVSHLSTGHLQQGIQRQLGMQRLHMGVGERGAGGVTDSQRLNSCTTTTNFHNHDGKR